MKTSPQDNHSKLREAIVSAASDLLDIHWAEAMDARDEDGKFSVTIKVSITDGDPIKYLVTTSIPKGTIKDEIRGTVTSDDQPELEIE